MFPLLRLPVRFLKTYIILVSKGSVLRIVLCTNRVYLEYLLMFPSQLSCEHKHDSIRYAQLGGMY